MKKIINIIKFYMSGICPYCGVKAYDRDEDTCDNCGHGKDRD